VLRPQFFAKKVLPDARLAGMKARNQKGAGVPYYDSIPTYDSGLFYDDPSSPQRNRNGFLQNRSGVACL
jgi:hypothetical protein